MKKFLLSVAAIATMAFSANAITGFTADSDSYSLTVADGANQNVSTLVTDMTGFTVAAASSSAELTLAAATEGSFKISDVTFTGVPGKLAYKIYPNYVASNSSTAGGYTNTMLIPTVSGEQITITLGNSGAALGADITITGASNMSTITNSQVPVGSQTPFVLTATGAITITLPNKARVYAVVGGGTPPPAGTNDAISSELLYSNGSALVNPTNLDVTVFSVSGAKVLSSSAAEINLSGLATGQYIAVTAQGNLKFVK